MAFCGLAPWIVSVDWLGGLARWIGSVDWLGGLALWIGGSVDWWLCGLVALWIGSVDWLPHGTNQCLWTYRKDAFGIPNTSSDKTLLNNSTISSNNKNRTHFQG